MQVQSSPAFFKQGPRPLALLVVYGLLSVSLLVADAHYQTLGWVRQKVSVMLYPLQWLATAPVSAAHQVGDFVSTQTALKQELRSLKDKELVSASQLLRLRALEAENAQLKSLTAGQAWQTSHRPGVLAEVLYHGRDPFVSKLIVDRGTTQGVKAGSVVIDAQGLVGQVTRVQPLVSEITLITDKQQPVPAQVLRNGLRAVVFGMGRENPLEVRFMPINADIQVGDELVTSGIDGSYPVGLPVARVIMVDRNTGSAFARVHCVPQAKVDHTRFFLLLDEARHVPTKPEEPVPFVAKSRRKE